MSNYFSFSETRTYPRPDHPDPRKRRSLSFMLVGILVSLRTTLENEQRAMDNILQRFRTDEELYLATEEEFNEAVKPAGMAAKRANLIKRALNYVDKELQRDWESLEALPLEVARIKLLGIPGFGPKAVDCLLSIGLGHPSMVVDVNVFHIASQLFDLPWASYPNYSDEKAVLQVKQILDEAVPKDTFICQIVHTLFLLYGKKIKRKKTSQEECLIKQYCLYCQRVSKQNQSSIQNLSNSSFIEKLPSFSQNYNSTVSSDGFTLNVNLLSLNVNGIRAASKKGFLNWLYDTNPYILCLQETKASRSQLSRELLDPSGYYAYWNSGTKPGYSGTAILSKEKPISVQFGLGIDEFDREGRVIIAEYYDFILINCYFPNGGRDHSRVPFKLAFYNAFIVKCEELFRKKQTVIFCGDVNTAHKEFDLARPRANENKTGFLIEERNWIDKVIEAGYIDTFRFLFPQLKGQYTWWSNRANARGNNVGWRLDYFFMKSRTMERLTSAFIVPEVNLSDHCPVGISLTIKNHSERILKEVQKTEPEYYQLELLSLGDQQ